ncbi:DUF2938 family protein [Desulfobacter curvatus]|uniref:DUF2938 family protein n=1 Tax=Desulfobacter curvatus TaxID=2290 RepID=UPI0009FD6049
MDRSFPKGCFVHRNITETPYITGERPIGWCAHYVIGIAFAGVLLFFYGPAWTHKPTLFPAILIGVVTVRYPHWRLPV